MSEAEETGILTPIFLKLPSEHIVLLKFILESYEGLGILRTLNSQTGEVVILAVEETLGIVNQVLETLEDELHLRRIPPPASVAEDWLLREEFKNIPH